MSRSLSHSPGTRIMLATVLICTTLPAVARAQQVTKTQDKNNDFSTTVGPACNGDSVAINGKSMTRIEQSAEGANRFRFRSQQHDFGTGFGTPSSSNYQYQDMNVFETVSSTQTFTFAASIREHLIRQGKSNPPRPGDDLFISVRTRFTVNNGNVTKDQFRDSGVQCK